jgi:GR25 family glycosyltransferase involved in LPS biosynthesis
MKIFVINLDSATDRWEYYKDNDKFTRWSAFHWKDIAVTNPIFEKMISYYNIDPDQHKAKCGCLYTHMMLWRYIIDNKIDDVLILEDDALLMNELPTDLPQDGFTYLGGFTSDYKITKGPKKIKFKNGINEIKHSEYKVLTTMAYYIPHWSIAHKMLRDVKQHDRYRAVDVMIRDTRCNQYVSYPASFIERPGESQIRKNNIKYCTDTYEYVGITKFKELYPDIFN